MLNLFKLELRRNNLIPYIIASAIVFACVATISLFVAYDKSDPQTYNSLINLVSMLTMISFAVVSSVMYSKFLISEYHGEARSLLFSYPIKRSKILIAKVALILIFTVFAVLICNSITFLILNYTKNINQVIVDELTTETLFMMIRYTVLAAAASGVFGFISFLIGFWMKSIPAAIITAVIIGAALNSVLGMATQQMIIVGLCLFIAIGAILIFALIKKVNKMEVD